MNDEPLSAEAVAELNRIACSLRRLDAIEAEIRGESQRCYSQWDGHRLVDVPTEIVARMESDRARWEKLVQDREALETAALVVVRGRVL